MTTQKQKDLYNIARQLGEDQIAGAIIGAEIIGIDEPDFEEAIAIVSLATAYLVYKCCAIYKSQNGETLRTIKELQAEAATLMEDRAEELKRENGHAGA